MVNSGRRHRLSPRLALGHEDAAAQILAGHVEKRLGRLDHRRVDAARCARAANSASRIAGEIRAG